MLFHPQSIAPPLFSCLLAFALFACDHAPSHSLRSLGDTPDPAPTQTETFSAKTSRYLGQSSFLSYKPGYFWYDDFPGPIAAVSKGEQREIQEADLYAFGALGEDVVYVLNPYRGLEVLNFREDLGQKALVTRIPPSPYSAIEMYRPITQPLLIILERMDTDAAGHWIPDSATRLAIYSVRNPLSPQFLEEIKVPGDYTDSRLVGDILYVATTLSHYQDNTWDARAKLSAFALSPEGLKAVDDYVAPLPLRSRDSLQVLQTGESGELKTFAILTLQANLWSAWNRESTLEWVDLSDPGGQIKPLLRVTTEGQVRERSASFVHDHALLAVSNSWVRRGEQMIRRISVESFTLPGPDATILNAEQAEARKLWLEQQLAALPHDEATQTEAKRKLIEDPTHGLKGVFVRSTDGQTLEKLTADALVQTQDDSGMHADIQDVRLSGDLLYVFWVPANQIDPLDIFDIGDAAKEIRFLQRTLFPGWVERAFPISFQDRNYILALGWIRPEGSEFWQRQAQAILFTITEDGNAKIASQLTLKGDSVWSYFNDQDKTISWLPLDEGKGRVLFPMQAGGEQPLQGAKLVSYQLDPPQLTEGPTLAAHAAGWLRRVFANKQLERFQTLSDRSFDSFSKLVYRYAADAQVVQAEASIELARDVVAYYPLGSLGLQIVRKNSSWRDDGIELRLTPTPDSEKSRILATRNLPGQLVSSYPLSPREIAVITRTFGENGISSVHIVSLAASTPKLSIVTQNWKSETEVIEPLYKMIHRPIRDEATWGTLKDGSILFEESGNIHSLTRNANTWTFSSVELPDSCRLKTAVNELTILDGQAFLMSAEALEEVIPDRHTYRIEKMWLRALYKDGEAWSCHNPVNIPGRPIAFNGQQLICEDHRIMTWQTPEAGSSGAQPLPAYPLTQRVLISLDWNGKNAQLRDLYDAETIVDPIRTTADFKLGFLTRKGEEASDYLYSLSLDAQTHFVQKIWLIPERQRPQDPLLVFFAGDPLSPDKITAWRDGHTLSVFKAAARATELQRLPLWERTVGGTWMAKDTGYLPSYAFWGWRSSGDTFVRDTVHGTLTAAQGLWGVSEWYSPELISSP